MLKISNLVVEADKRKVIKNLSLAIKAGEFHVLMGPNGAGKTSLVMTLMGKPGYKIVSGEITFDNKNINKLSTDKRARLGLFASFQKPPEIPGITLHNLLKSLNIDKLEDKIKRETATLKFSEELLSRSWENFSGGEAKKIELFQAKILKPRFLILDEIDSGLDLDSLKTMTENLKEIMVGNKAGILLITHNPRILKILRPDFLHILVKGEIVKTDGPKLTQEIEKKGFQWLTKN